MIWRIFIINFLLFIIPFSVFAGTGFDHHVTGGKNTGPISAPGIYQGFSTPRYKGFSYRSFYLKMRDSTLLATDVFLPKNLEAGKKIPAILYITRYVRSLKAKFPINVLKHPLLVVVPEKEIEFFTSHGYACIIVDARGSGASLGSRKMEFSAEEIADGKEIVDWIISQPWSNGKVGTTGVSYVGTSAEMLLVNQHPAVKACIPRSSIFDLYGHIMFPGGVRAGPFIEIWGKTTQSLDQNEFSVFGKKAERLLFGINPVQRDKKHNLYQQAIAQHSSNFDIIKGIRKVECRDEVHEGLGVNSESFSVHHYKEKIEASGTPIYRIGGWYDGALCKSVIDGMNNTANTQKALIGPWDHGPQNNVSPFAAHKKVEFDVLTEMLRFFDFHLKGIQNGIDKEPRLRYYTIGEETWKTTDEWPLSNQVRKRFYLNCDKTLSNYVRSEGKIEYKVDYTACSGVTSRWNSITQLYMNGPTDYGDRAEENKKLISFTTPPLDKVIEITGHPWVDVYWSGDAEDATVF
ncbi:MAG: CocE/NonD family hydrolase, partial [Chitinophagales bacterium]|nr:CocE/NonD family hydrolase [Chitinophagales bacterium]